MRGFHNFVKTSRILVVLTMKVIHALHAGSTGGEASNASFTGRRKEGFFQLSRCFGNCIAMRSSIPDRHTQVYCEDI